MAERTIRPVSFSDGAAYAEYVYEDTTGQVLLVRGVNDSPNAMWVRISGTADSGPASGTTYEYTFPAWSGVTEWTIPLGQRKRFTLVPDNGDPGRPDYYPTLGGLVIEASG